MTYQLLPPLTADDEDRLRTSIRERGVEVPVVVDETGTVIDGHHRDRIARELGIDCPRVVKKGLAEHEKRILAVELNVARRQFTDAQRIEAGRAIEPDIAERARLRMLAAQKNRAGEQLATTVASCQTGRTIDEVARTVRLGSGRTYERGKQTMQEAEREAPDLLPAIHEGKIDLPEVRKELKRRVPTNPVEAEFLADAQSVVDQLPQEDVNAGFRALIEAEELPTTARIFGEALVALHKARLKIRQVRPDLLRQLVDSEPEERRAVEEAVSVQREMMDRCRDALGVGRDAIRRVV